MFNSKACFCQRITILIIFTCDLILCCLNLTLLQNYAVNKHANLVACSK